MKKYVFLTFAVSGIGGTQIYVRNKLIFLQAYGWDVTVISTEPGDDICVKELLPYKDYILPKLIENPYMLAHKERVFLIEKMEAIIGRDFDEIVIETNFIAVTLWGEMLAAKINAKHFAYLIQEAYDITSAKYLKFFDYKYKRGELAGTTKYALKMLFGNYRKIDDEQTGELTAICHNVIEDCDSPLIRLIDKADFNIGSIGRVNKPFVNTMIDDIVDYSKQHTDKTFLFVLFGGSPDKSDLETAYEKVSNQKNLKIIITGPIFPIPFKALSKMDVFISSAGAAVTSADAGFITIAMDANDYEPIGILGYTTSYSVHRDASKPHQTTAELLDQILIGKDYTFIKPEAIFSSTDYMEVFKIHMQYLARSIEKLEYYRISKVRPKWITIIIKRLLNDDLFYRVNLFYNKVKQKSYLGGVAK